jgi:hypothetical protein
VSSPPTINFNLFLKTKVEIGIGTRQKLELEKFMHPSYCWKFLDDEWDFLKMIS